MSIPRGQARLLSDGCFLTGRQGVPVGHLQARVGEAGSAEKAQPQIEALFGVVEGVTV